MVSVVIPTFNRARFVVQAIESCYAAAAGLEIDVIVVDDASSDDTGDVAKSYPVRYFRFERNRGRCAARNFGIDQSQAKYVKFLDSDDTLEPSSLPWECDLAERSGADIVAAGWHVSTINSDGVESIVQTLSAPAFNSHVDCLLAGKAVPTAAALYRRSTLKNVRWVDVGPLDDWDFFIHAVLNSERVVTLARPVYRWRQHRGERVSGQAMLVTAECFYRVMDRFHEFLLAGGLLTPARRKRLADYYYKELRVLFRYAPDRGAHIEQKILSIDPEFRPGSEERSRTIRLLGQFVPLHLLLTSYGTVRRLVDRIRNA